MKLPRALEPVEARVLGALLEKSQATPDYYPMTVKALVAACNQKNNRQPVTDYTEGKIRHALETLRADVLVWRTDGARVDRWNESITRRLGLEPAQRALITLLLLRGPQTLGELRSRSERLHPFPSTDEVEAALEGLRQGTDPDVQELPRQPGHKESRWRHLLGEDADELPAQVASSPPAAVYRSVPNTPAATPRASETEALDSRVAELERQMESVLAELRILRAAEDESSA